MNRLENAIQLGREAGERAGEWAADGNTSAESARAVLALMDDGDPRAWDFLPPVPNLSGEWADDPTPRSIFEEVEGRGIDADDPDDIVRVDGCADAWETGVQETFESACEAALRAVAGDAPSSFSLDIDMENAEMANAEHVAAALRRVADVLTGQDIYPGNDSKSGIIWDDNGNHVGGWGFDQLRDKRP